MGQGKHSNWKMSKGEALKHKLSKPSTFRNFNKIEKGAILCTIMVLGLLALSYGLYVNQYLPSLQKPDPYTTLWNGQATGNFGRVTGDQINIFGPCAINTNCNLPLTSPATGQLIIVELIQFSKGLCSSPDQTVTDSQGNTYTNQINGSYDCKQNNNHSTMTEWSTTLATSAADTITVKDTGSDVNIDAWQFHATNGNLLSIAAFTTFTTTGLATHETLNVSSVPPFAMVLDMFSAESSNGGCSTFSFSQVGGSQLNSIADFGGCQSEVGYNTRYNLIPVQRGSTQGFVNVTTTFTIPALSSIRTLHVILELQSFPFCPASYSCGDGSHAFFNSDASTGQTIQLSPNATFPGVSVSTSAIDLSTSVSKALALSVFSVLPTGGSYASNERTAWYLTSNTTLPNQAGYDPLNDSSVVLIVYQFVTTPGSNANYYVYLQRQPGQTLTVGSTNPGTSNCNFGGTLFICGAFSIPNNQNSNIQSLVLNFTGGANNGVGPNNQAGQSYLCAGSINFGTHTCNLGGYLQTPISFLAQVVNQTLFPWLNIQTQYHIGFWEAAGGNPFSYIVTPGSNSPIFSVYVPPASSLNPNQSDTSFIGYLTRSVGGFFSGAGNFLGTTFGPVLNLGASFLSAIVNGFVQVLSIELQEFRIVLNYIGGLLHLGNIGDVLFNALIAIGTLITNGFSAIVGAFVGLGDLISSGYFSFLAGAFVLIGTLLPIAIVLWNIIFNAAFTVNDLLFIDYSIGMIMVANAVRKKRGALKAFFGWIALNKFLFVFLFNAAWLVFDIVTRPIHRTKETVDPVG